MELYTYILRRLVLLIPVLFGVVTITFVVTHVIPVDPIALALGPNAPPAIIAKLRHDWGFDRPLYEQYFEYMWRIMNGDLGKSILSNEAVTVDLTQRFPYTFELATMALLISVSVGIPLGVISATNKDRVADHFARIGSLFGLSMPVFWLGLMILVVFYYYLGWIPGPGAYSPAASPPPPVTGFPLLDCMVAGDWNLFWDHLQRLMVPSLVLGLYSTGAITRMTRSSMLEVLSKFYIKTAKSKGLMERVVIVRHALRNAIIPTVTIIGYTYGFLLEGAVLTETVFGWPGLGSYLTGAILRFDYMAVTGATLLIALIYSLCSLTVDLLYGFLDPRIRHR